LLVKTLGGEQKKKDGIAEKDTPLKTRGKSTLEGGNVKDPPWIKCATTKGENGLSSRRRCIKRDGLRGEKRKRRDIAQKLGGRIRGDLEKKKGGHRRLKKKEGTFKLQGGRQKRVSEVREDLGGHSLEKKRKAAQYR